MEGSVYRKRIESRIRTEADQDRFAMAVDAPLLLPPLLLLLLHLLCTRTVEPIGRSVVVELAAPAEHSFGQRTQRPNEYYQFFFGFLNI